MKLKNLIFPLLAVLVTSCTGTPSTSTPSDNTSQTPSDTTSEVPPSSETPVSEPGLKSEIDASVLNGYFGFDLYALLPSIRSNDYEYYDNASEDYPVDIYIDLFDWADADGIAYDTALDALFEVDEQNGYIITSEVYGFAFLDEESYDTPTWSINLYTMSAATPVDPEPPVDKAEIDSAPLNTFFGFDVYTLLPKIYSEDYDFYDDSSEDYPIDIYIDLFDWLDADAFAYDAALAAQFEVDEQAGYIITTNLYGYVFLDEETYETPTWSFNIYTVGPVDPIDPVDPVDPVEPGTVVTATIDSKDTAAVTEAIADGSILSHLLVTNGTNLTVSYAANASSVRTIFNNSANEIRLYAGAGNGGALTIGSTNNVTFTSITVNTSTNTGYTINGGSSITSASQKTSLTADTKSVTILNVGTGQVRITSIEIEYVGDGTVVPTDPTPELEVGTPGLLTGTQTVSQYQKDNYGYSSMPSTGAHDVLVVPVEINGVAFPSNYKSNLDLLFNGTSEATGWESVSSYYNKSSYGSLDLTFDINDKVVTTNNKSYFDGIGSNADEYAIADVMNKLSSVNFADYDSNTDGIVDSVIFIYSASISYSGDDNPWWAWVFNGQYFEDHAIPTQDGKELGYYMWASYEFMFEDTLAVNANVNAETYIHEFGHLLGAPDYYSTTHGVGPLGGFDMMDFNAGDHGPLNKLLWGWIDPLVAPIGYEYNINLDSYALDTDGNDVAILIPRSNTNLSDGDAFDEYLLVMYYTPNGLYNGHMGTTASITEPGIVIYHVDARLASNASEWDYFLNNSDGTSNFLVSILEADNNNSIPSSSAAIQNSDILRSGIIDLSSYTWNQGGKIDVKISITTMTTSGASLNIEVR